MTKFVDICQPSYSITAVTPEHNRDGGASATEKRVGGH